MTPDLHDGSLTGLVLLEKDGLEVYCRTVEGVAVTLKLGGLFRLKADNFLQGNIILDVAIKRGEEIDRNRVAEVVQESPNNPYVTDTFREAVAGNWVLLEISSSYGCELAALARHIEVVA